MPRTTTAVMVCGVWNSFIKLGLPVLALALVALQGNAGAGRVTAALIGLAGLAAAIVVFVLILRSEETARLVGLRAARIASRIIQLLHRSCRRRGCVLPAASLPSVAGAACGRARASMPTLQVIASVRCCDCLRGAGLVAQ